MGILLPFFRVRLHALYSVSTEIVVPQGVQAFETVQILAFRSLKETMAGDCGQQNRARRFSMSWQNCQGAG